MLVLICTIISASAFTQCPSAIDYTATAFVYTIASTMVLCRHVLIHNYSNGILSTECIRMLVIIIM